MKIPGRLCVLILVIGGVVVSDVIAKVEPTGVWLTGAKFRHELDQPFSVSSTQSEFRQTIIQIASDRRLSIVLDRRLDPMAVFSFDVNHVSLKAGLVRIAEMANADATFTENTVFLAPKTAAKRFRTVVELRRTELAGKELDMPDRRRTDLQRRRLIEWRDLDTPREILASITRDYRLQIVNPEAIPHDLWAENHLPEASMIEALSIILIQFDQTFRWKDSGASIELIAIPSELSIERKYRSKQKTNEVIKQIRHKFPQVNAEVVNSEIVVKGLFEDQEKVSAFLRGDVTPRATKTELAEDLSKQLFTFKTELPVPLIAVIKKLEESEIHFEYDLDALKAAGIDMEQLVEIDVKNASFQQFLKSIFLTSKIEFQLQGSTVKLKPKNN